MSTTERMKPTEAILGVWASTLAALLISTLLIGWNYYVLPTELRPQHWLDAWLRPGGPVGVLLGLVGTLLLLGIVAYRVRKWLWRFKWLGSMTTWMQFHIVCGVVGPLYIIVHAGVAMPHGFIAVGFWCMVLVGLSGVFGRYVYGHLPGGTALEDLERAKADLFRLRERLVLQTAGTGSAALAGFGQAVDVARGLQSTPQSLAGLVRFDRDVREREQQIRRVLGTCQLPPMARRQAADNLLEQLRLHRNIGAWAACRRLFRYWHLFHMPLARAMYILVALHILNAVVLGGALLALGDLLPW